MLDFTEAMLGGWAGTAPSAKSLEPIGNAWRADLPSSLGEAQHALQLQHEALARDQAAIALAVARLKAFIDDYPPEDAGTAKAVQMLPEATLHDQLTMAAGAQSKGLLDPLDDVRAEFNQFMQRVREFVSDFASIETAQAGADLARTKVGWTGDVQTVWLEAISPAQRELHWQNVRVALARRGLLMRLMVVISTGAAKIAIRLATPGMQLLALPAIFQFIRDIVQEVRQMQKMQPT